MLRYLLALSLVVITTACGGGGSTAPTPGGGDPKPPVTAIKGVFRKNAPGTPAASVVAPGLKAAATATTATTSTTMSSARKYHRGIKLLDGKLLIFGGSTDNNGVNALASAEVFDPATELFAPVGSMTVARVLPAMTRMPDGRVVVVGGVATPDAKVDIYDPATQTWTGLPTTTLDQYNAFPCPSALFALPGNRVLFYGGKTGYLGNAYMPAQVIDLSTGATTQITDTLHQRTRFATVELNDGTFLVTGGETAGGTSSDIIKIDPATLTITKIGQMTAPRIDHSMLVYPDGLVEVYGGIQIVPTGDPIRLTSVETINLTTATTQKVGDFQAPRSLMESNLLQNGISLHGGGPDKNGFVVDTQLTYEHGTNLSTVTNQMVYPRVYFVSLVMNNGRVLYAGGSKTDGTVLNNAEIFDSYSLVMIQGTTDQVQLDPTVQATIQMTLVAGGPVTWTASVGTVDASGLWTAPKWVVGSKNNPTKVRLTATSTADSTSKASFDATLVPFDESTLP